MSHPCTLCGEESRELFFIDKKREFFLCTRCGLVFVPEKYYLSEKEEKDRYDLHENTPDNSGYMEFLKNFADIALDHATPPGRGLDFGSGPVPVLADLLRTRGFDMSVYDPFYSPGHRVFDDKYHLITMMEVMEHLMDPMKEIRRLRGCLEPGGVIAVRTETVPENREKFRPWSYKNDLTHICFFSPRVFRWMAGEIGFRLLFPAPHVVLMFRI